MSGLDIFAWIVFIAVYFVGLVIAFSGVRQALSLASQPVTRS